MIARLDCLGDSEFLYYEEQEYITENGHTYYETVEFWYCADDDYVYQTPHVTEGAGSVQIVNQIIMAVPVGVMLPYAGIASSVPVKYLLCDGRQFTSAQYPELFAVIGQSFGGTGAAFNIPRMQGRVIVGIDPVQENVTGANVRGATGGSQTHVLTVPQIPAHSHTTNVQAAPGSQTLLSVATTAVSRSGSATSLTGGGLGHNNLQPYVVMNYMIKAVPD